MTKNTSNLSVHVTGIVQGVGFRPFVYTLAKRLGLTGWVSNSSNGVNICISGPTHLIDEFISNLKNSPPPLARIDSISTSPAKPIHSIEFAIRESVQIKGGSLPVPADIATCPDCLRELFTSGDRRFHYPFINCTNCGPRFTIIRDIPYDRPFTTMDEFTMCEWCRSEYIDPGNRRYHAQPISCPNCGPVLSYHEAGQVIVNEEAILSARAALANGKILAIKGLGGYHLACDASNSLAVSNLRNRKRRTDKPLALMAYDTSVIKKYAMMSQTEFEYLNSPQHPILLLKRIADPLLSNEIAPNQSHLGFMLPYTPLHHLLLHPEQDFPEVLVMTSGNYSEEPIAFLDEDAFTRLESIADGFLMHDRKIHTRVDDSVTRIVKEKAFLIRRSRGFAPDPMLSPHSLKQVLACGAELKNTFSLSKQKYIFISHHIGDLENLETLNSYEDGIEHFKSLFRVNPEAVAIDLHPDYLSTRYGNSVSERSQIPLIQIQHHHAHLASCLADNQWESNEQAIGLIFDGTGYGTDQAIWGGEILIGNYNGFQRRFHLKEIPLPGGDSAIRNPARIALSHLLSANIDWDDDLPPVKYLCADDRTMLRSQITHHINTPLTTSMGRLFDAVSSLIDIRHKVSYEGQAAIELENVCDENEISTYDFAINQDTIFTDSLLSAIVNDYRAQLPVGIISARFHNAIARVCLLTCQQIHSETGINSVALSGGVWQNIKLLTKTIDILSINGFNVLFHHQIPTNDGGISVGQVMIANSTLISMR